jgi:hypothetical protein
MDQYLRAALDNITRHGDTDVFPFPIENQVFFDKPADALVLLQDVHADFEAALSSYPPLNQKSLAAVGYTGFRWATQVDPLWNAYLLGLVIALGDEIEAQRLPKSKRIVFSYRFAWDKEAKTLFDKTSSWPQFQERSIELARQSKHVLVCDISDFYPRIYHHRLGNALKRASNNTEVTNRIMELLKHFSGGVSYGLPVGGPAARLLSELLLNRVDRLLATAGITFCRYSDDYHIFAATAEDAYGHLVFLSEKLLENEGLLLQKAKTRVMSAEEFLNTVDVPADSSEDTKAEWESRQFMRLRLHFDPYAATAKVDYENLKDELSKFDIVGMLTREMNKTRVHQALARRLISALQYLEEPVLNAAVLSLVENLAVLYPVFPSVALLIRDAMPVLTEATRDHVFARLRDLVRGRSYIVSVPTNLAYTVHLLAHDRSEEADALLIAVYNATSNFVIRRDVILAMARRDADYWLSDVRNRFPTQTSWERNATLVGSFILGDEGAHWRRAIMGQLTPLQKLVVAWAAERKAMGRWEIPI